VTAPARRMLTSEEAADYCGFKSVNGFLAYVKVRPVNFGKMVRYDRNDLDDYLNTFRQSAPGSGFAELAGNAGADRGR
jgi:hypothetical protein